MFLQLFTVVMTLVALYVCGRLVLPLPYALGWRLLGCAGVLLAANRITIVRLFDVRLSDAALLVTSWIQASVLVLFMLCLAADVVSLVLRLSVPPVARAAVLGAAALLLGVYGVAQAVRVPPVRETPVVLRGLPPELDGMRIAVLADLHVGPLFRRPWVERVVDATLAAKPDLIVLPGDVVDGPLDSLAADMAPLARLRAPLGVFVSPGNHEYIYGVEERLRSFAVLGMTVLYNGHAVVDAGGATLVVAGLADRAGGHRPGKAPDMDAALAGAPEPGAAAFRLLLAHHPAVAAEAAAHGVGLQISGHTHGGQLLPMRPLSAWLNGGYVGGWYEVGGMALLVANGAGLWSGTPVRLGVPSAIDVVRLVRRGEKP
ncbi:MAG: metallophosphoesterase [Desulfovibrionaceae bacterium]